MPGVSDPGTLRSSWRVLMASPERILVATIAISLPAVVLQVLLQILVGLGVAGNAACTRRFGSEVLVARCGPTNAHAQLALVVGLFVVFVLAHLVVAGLDRVALDVIDGVPVRGPFRGWNVLGALPVALVLGAVLTVATMLLLLPGLVLGFFTRYAMLVVVDGGEGRTVGPFAAIGASFELVGRRFVSEIGFALRAAAVLLLGVLALVVGLYVAVPLVLIAQAARYRAARPLTVSHQPA